MKYMVAAEGKELDSQVARRFGHAPFYLLVDGSTWEYEVVDRMGDDLPEHGAGFMIERNTDCVITGNIGPTAFEQLSARGISVYIFRATSVRDAIESVESGKIEPAKKPTLKKSIHENAGAHGNHEHGPGRGMGGGRGMGRGHGKGHGHHGG